MYQKKDPKFQRPPCMVFSETEHLRSSEGWSDSTAKMQKKRKNKISTLQISKVSNALTNTFPPG